MKVYVKCKKNSNSGLVIGKSETFTKAIYGFSELGCEIIPYELCLLYTSDAADE